jgi:hypothetical protein
MHGALSKSDFPRHNSLNLVCTKVRDDNDDDVFLLLALLCFFGTWF